MTDAPERVWMDPDIKFPECEKQYGCDVEYVRKDIAEAALTEVTEDRDDALIALASARKQLERYIREAEQRVAKLEAALVAAYRLALGDAQSIAEMHRDHCGLDQNGCLYVSEEAQIFASAVAHEIAGGVFNTPTPTAEELMARIKEPTDDQ